MSAIKFGTSIRELRILLCQTSKSSQGVREFITQQYVAMKKHNPKFPILIRECSDIEPKVFARYEHGNEKSFSLTNLSSDDVASKIKQLAAGS